MKNKILAAAVVLALVGLTSMAPALAEDTSTTDHKGGMMDMGPIPMDMEQMMRMKHECMSMNKDGKMCDNQMMEKCQMKISKGECKKMMNQAKAEDKKIKK